MSWTATLTELRNEGSEWKYEITYTNGAKKIIKAYRTQRLDDDTILATVRSESTQLVNAAKVAPTLTVGTVLNPLLPPPEPVAISPEQVARSAFAADYRMLRTLRNAAAEGFIAQSDPRIAALSASLRTRFKDAYVELLG